MKVYKKLGAALLLVGLFMHHANGQSIYSAKTGTMPTHIGELATNVGDGYGQYRSVGFDSFEAPPAVIGNTFLTDNWSTGTLYFTLNRMLETEEFKYDLENNQFIIKTVDTPEPTLDHLRVIYSNTVDAFVLNDPIVGKRIFINATNTGLTEEGQPMIGFVEVLVNDSSMSLYRKIDTKLLPASYNVALNAGSKSDRIIKNEKYYLREGDQKELDEVAKKKKQTLALFSSKQDELERFVKKNDIKLDSQVDLVKLVNYYNRLPK